MGKPMINSNNRGRMLALFGAALSLLGLLIPPPLTEAGAPAPQASECQGGVGGRLFSSGGRIEVEILAADAGFTIELHLVSPGPSRFIATNRETGTVVNLGTISEGTELIFAAYVRETQREFRMGSGSANPDGIPHADVNCFNSRRANVGFEDQLGGGDRDYNDLLCSVRQIADGGCNYLLSSSSQSFDSRGGSGNFSVSPSSGCSWNASSNANWIEITSGNSGSSSGTVRYSVASNGGGSRSGTISIQSQTYTVFQDGISGQPEIFNVERDGKRLYVYGINFGSGSTIYLNGDWEKTKPDPDNPNSILVGKKAGKHIRPGDTLRVQNSSGAYSAEYQYNP